MPSELTQALALGASAFVIGLSGAMAPGSYLVATVTRTLRHGRVSAALMLVGHALLEAALIFGFAFGLADFLKLPTVMTALALIGGVILIWMGQDLLRGAVNGSISLKPAEEIATRTRLGPVAQGAAVSISNPYWTLWWATIGVKLASDGIAIGPVGVIAFFIGHELADVAWYGTVIGAVSHGRGLLADRPYRIVLGVCAAFLLYLGVRFLLDGAGVI